MPESFPQMCDVRQRFKCPQIHDVASVVRDEITKLDLENISRGDTVALTAGSRGIANIVPILNQLVTQLQDIGARPFVVTAMGSHGGATAEGQQDVLKQLGITEQSIGCEIKATMDTVVVAQSNLGLPVHFDQHADSADHVLVVGRIKPHTRFAGPIESGLHKMLLIGLGNRAGAETYHKAIQSFTFQQIIEDIADAVLGRCRILGGIAIVENAVDQTALIEAVKPQDFRSREPQLLQLAKDWLPSLPLKEIDVLIIDRIGKNISGVGMDANIVGRKYNDHAATEKDAVSCRRILIRSLTPQTQGNATGIGMAEFTTEECVAQVDHQKTAVNCVTSSHPEAGMIPLVFVNDRDALAAALKTIGHIAAKDAKVVQIADTLHLSKLKVSQACLNLLPAHAVQDGPMKPFEFDIEGRLQDIAVSPKTV